MKRQILFQKLLIFLVRAIYFTLFFLSLLAKGLCGRKGSEILQYEIISRLLTNFGPIYNDILALRVSF